MIERKRNKFLLPILVFGVICIFAAFVLALSSAVDGIKECEVACHPDDSSFTEKCYCLPEGKPAFVKSLGE